MALPLVASARASAQGTLLAPLGVLRAVYLAGTPVQALRDPATGALRGIAYDLARELARRADIGLTFESRPAPAQVINAVLSGAADIGFVANAPFHSDPVLYSHNYLRTPHSVVVGASSPIHILAELDRPGLRIGAARGDPFSIHLGRTLAAARFVPLDSVAPATVARHLADGTLDAFGASRHRLRQLAALVPGLRTLPGSLFGEPQALIVPATAPARLALVDAFLHAVTRDGFLQTAIARSDTEAEIQPNN